MAATVLDVDNLIVAQASGGSGARSIPSFGYDAFIYQTFTVGITGYLSSIDLFGSSDGAGNVYLDLFRGGTKTTVGTTALGRISKPNVDIVDYGVTKFDVQSLRIFASAGETLTFKASVDSCLGSVGDRQCYNGFYNWYALANGVNTNQYAGGSGFYQMGAGSPDPAYGDLNFRTFVNTTPLAPVPEPATWAMMMLGFGGIGYSLRRKAVLRYV